MYFVILGNILVHQNWQKANLNTLGHIWAVHKIRPKHVSSETIKINYSSICGWLPHSLLNILVSTPGSAPPWEMMILNQLCSAPERPCAWLRPMKCRQTGQTLLLSRASQSSAMRPPPPPSLSRVRLFVTPWTIPSMEFSRPEYWSGLLFPSPGDLPNPGINPGFLHCRRILYQMSHKRSPRMLAWVAYPFSSGSSWPRNWTGVSCIAGGFFTNWATLTREYSFSQRSKVKNME